MMVINGESVSRYCFNAIENFIKKYREAVFERFKIHFAFIQ